MQHWTLNVPLPLIAPFVPVVTVMPAPEAMSTFVALAPATHSGATTVLPDASLRGGTRPPPKLATTLNVWTSPPRLSTRKAWPELTRMSPPPYSQAATRLVAASSARNASSVTLPWKLGLHSAPNVAGSH